MDQPRFSRPAARPLLRHDMRPDRVSWTVYDVTAAQLVGLSDTVASGRWLSFSLQVFPGALPSIRPSWPRALNRTTQSRIVCNPTPPIRAALVREPPS